MLVASPPGSFTAAPQYGVPPFGGASPPFGGGFVSSGMVLPRSGVPSPPMPGSAMLSPPMGWGQQFSAVQQLSATPPRQFSVQYSTPQVRAADIDDDQLTPMKTLGTRRLPGEDEDEQRKELLLRAGLSQAAVEEDQLKREASRWQARSLLSSQSATVLPTYNREERDYTGYHAPADRNYTGYHAPAVQELRDDISVQMAEGSDAQLEAEAARARGRREASFHPIGPTLQMSESTPELRRTVFDEDRGRYGGPEFRRDIPIETRYIGSTRMQFATEADIIPTISPPTAMQAGVPVIGTSSILNRDPSRGSFIASPLGSFVAAPLGSVQIGTPVGSLPPPVTVLGGQPGSMQFAAGSIQIPGGSMQVPVAIAPDPGSFVAPPMWPPSMPGSVQIAMPGTFSAPVPGPMPPPMMTGPVASSMHGPLPLPIPPLPTSYGQMPLTGPMPGPMLPMGGMPGLMPPMMPMPDPMHPMSGPMPGYWEQEREMWNRKARRGRRNWLEKILDSI